MIAAKFQNRNEDRRRSMRFVLLAVTGCLVVCASAVADEGPAKVKTNAPARISVENDVESNEAVSNGIIRRRNSESDRETGASDSEKSGFSGVSLTGGSATEMFWPLLVVLGLMFGALMILKRIMPNKLRVAGGSAIRIVARQYLSSKQSFCLVQVGRRVVLVGITGDSMTALCEMNDQEEIGELAAKVERGRSSSFSTALSRFGADDDTSDDAPAAPIRRAPQKAAGPSAGETEKRVRDLVARIRAMSVGSAE